MKVLLQNHNHAFIFLTLENLLQSAQHPIHRFVSARTLFHDLIGKHFLHETTDQ